MVKTLEDIKYFIIPELYEYLKDVESGEGADITALETAVGALETAVGDAEAGLVKDVADIETAIGDESTEGTILYRLKVLEDAQTPANETTEPAENTEPTEPSNP